MKKIKFTAVIISLLMILSLVGCSSSSAPSTTPDKAPAADGKTYDLIISDLPSDDDPVNEGMRYFKQILEERAQGRIKVTLYTNKALSNSTNEDLEKCSQGIIQMTTAPTYSTAAVAGCKEFQIFDLPYLFKNNDEVYKVLDSEVGQGWRQTVEKNLGVRVFGGYVLGWNQVSAKKDLATLADFKNVKVRVMSSESQQATIKSLGANPAVVNYGELYTALQQGTVDGMLTSTNFWVSDRFYEVQKSLAVINCMPHMHTPVVNVAWFNGLPEDLQKTFLACMDDYLTHVRKTCDDAQATYLDTLKEKGMKINIFEGQQLQEIVDLVSPVSDECADMVGGADTLAAVRKVLGR